MYILCGTFGTNTLLIYLDRSSYMTSKWTWIINKSTNQLWLITFMALMSQSIWLTLQKKRTSTSWIDSHQFRVPKVFLYDNQGICY